MKKYNNIVATLAVIFTVLYAIAVIVFIILTALKLMDWVSLVIFIVSGAVELILLWALNNALERIGVLENVLNKKGVVEKKDIEEELDGFSVEPDENLRHCETCGYQLFPEDKVCPNCGAEVNTIKVNDEL